MSSDETVPSTRTCPVWPEFDPFGVEFGQEPGPALAEARHERPIFYSPVLDAYVVTKFSDIRTVFASPGSFSSREMSRPLTPLREAGQATLEARGYKTLKAMAISDEPEHMRLRRLLDEPFSVANIRTQESRVREIYGACVDRVVTRGTADLVSDIMADAPAAVAFDFLGIPEEDRAELKGFGKGMATFVFGQPTDDEQVEACDLMGRNQQYSRKLVARLIEDPEGPGFLRHAVRAHMDNPAELDLNCLVGLAMTGLNAAYETTSSAGASALLHLLSDETAWQEICVDPSLIPGAVEEALRFSPPALILRRLCVSETTIGETTIPNGGTVMLLIASGNHDGDVFPEPEMFDIRRENARRHLSFGTGGHRCLGAGLAQLQIRVLLEELTTRLPHMRLAGGHIVERLATVAFGGPLSLEVAWDPAQNPLPQDRPRTGER